MQSNSCRAHYGIAGRPPANRIVFEVASWGELEATLPEFASRVRSLMTSRKHLTMATVRRDGSPRISGTEIELGGGQIHIGSMPRAVKAQDLMRDPRVAIHGPTEDPPPAAPAGWKGEAKIAGTAIEVESGGPAHRFVIDIQEVVITHLNEAGDRLVVESWNPQRGLRTMERCSRCSSAISSMQMAAASKSGGSWPGPIATP